MTIIRVALEYDKPVRIGVNWGSLDQAAAHRAHGSQRGESGAARRTRRDDRGDDPVGAALRRAGRGDRPRATTGSSSSAKVSGVRDLVDVYRLLAARCDYPLHLGLTEAGMGDEGHRRLDRRAGAAAQGGDRRHDPRLADPGAGRRSRAEVLVAQQVLQSLGLRSFMPQVSRMSGLRPHDVDVLPGDGPGTSRATCGSRCRSGPPPTRAWRTCGSR